MKTFNILPKTYGFTSDYDPKVNPNIINSFATAAYRFHTLIQVNNNFNYLTLKPNNYSILGFH